MSLKRPTVTVAVSAYNEEANIEKFLRSVLKQKESGFILKAIWVYSDGSIDKTVEIARNIKSPKISVVDDKKRIGKSSRLNTFYKNLKSDYLIQSDADVIFSHSRVISNLVKGLESGLNIGMCGGNPQPLEGNTFTERAESVAYKTYLPILKKLHGGSSAFSVDGRILAYKKELVKKIRVPEDMIANDIYTYFCCISKGYEYKYIKSAIVNFRCPQTLNDKLRQNMRAASIPIRMSRYFGEELVKAKYSVPTSVRIKTMVIQLLKDPIKCTYIFLINHYSSLKASESEKTLTAKWPVAWTTKEL